MLLGVDKTAHTRKPRRTHTDIHAMASICRQYWGTRRSRRRRRRKWDAAGVKWGREWKLPPLSKRLGSLRERRKFPIVYKFDAF